MCVCAIESLRAREVITRSRIHTCTSPWPTCTSQQRAQILKSSRGRPWGLPPGGLLLDCVPRRIRSTRVVCAAGQSRRHRGQLLSRDVTRCSRRMPPCSGRHHHHAAALPKTRRIRRLVVARPSLKGHANACAALLPLSHTLSCPLCSVLDHPPPGWKPSPGRRTYGGGLIEGAESVASCTRVSLCSILALFPVRRPPRWRP